jgi:SAM-dependent methyltransferase
MKKSKYLTDSYHGENWFEPGGWQELSLVAASVKTGIFTALYREPIGAADLARSLALDIRAVRIVLEALAELGYVAEATGLYSLTKVAVERFGDPLARGYLGWAVLHSSRLVERWLTLPQVLETGLPVPGDRFSETIEGFIRAMDVYAGATSMEVADACLTRAPEAKTVLDIGGATGTVSKVMSDRGLSATLFDIPEAIEVIRAETEQSYPTIDLVGGDFNEALPQGPYDIAFLGNVTHIYGPEKNQALFKRVADNLSPGGLIAILDFVRGRSVSAAFFGINMLVNSSGGGTWTKVQYIDWLTDAGFKNIEIVDIEARDQQLIMGRLD